jgi:hypothetical protein
VRISPTGIAAAGIGLALFVWSLRQAGLDTIADGIRRVGAGFPIILALAGLRFLARARAWALATEGPTPLALRDTFPALVAGDALGNLTPLGVFLSEAVKAAFVRPRVTLMAALAGIAVENLVYTATVALVIAAGTVALLFLFEIGETVRHFALGALAVITVSLVAGASVLVRQIKLVSRTLAWLDRRGRGPHALVSRLAKLQTLEDLIYGFAGRNPGRVAGLLLLELLFHLLGIVEIWITLGLLAGSAAPTLLSTFVLESVNRTIMVVFKFVPLRLGVDELGTELLTRTIGLPAGIGVTMAVVRKARMIVWSAVGVGFLVRRGFRADTREAGGPENSRQ